MKLVVALLVIYRGINGIGHGCVLLFAEQSGERTA